MVTNSGDFTISHQVCKFGLLGLMNGTAFETSICQCTSVAQLKFNNSSTDILLELGM